MKKRNVRLSEPPAPSSRITNTQGILMMVILLLVIAFFGSLQYEQLTGKLVYRDSWYGGYSGYGGGWFGFSFSDIYAQHGYIIDAALFLLIFLGVGKGLFTKHFAEGGTAVYVGIGIFLAFALLLWEERSGVYLLEAFGPLVVVLFALVLLAWAFRWTKNAGMNAIPILCIGYLVFYWGLYGGTRSMYAQKIADFLASISLSEDLISFLGHVALLVLVGYIVWWLWKGRHSNNQASSSESSSHHH